MVKTWSIDPPQLWEKKIAVLLVGFFCFVIAVSTVLHHYYPYIMRVPDVPPPRVMPGLSYAWELAIGDLISLAVAGFVLYHGLKKYGLGMISLFFIGSMVFAGLEENEWILLSGRILGNKTYFFTRGGLWFLEIPVYTCLGWFYISYSCFEIFEILGKKWPRITRALAAGVFAMSLDLFADPVFVNIGTIMTPPSVYGLWVWENVNTLRLFSIPLMNFVGWALLVFLFCLMFGYLCDHKDTADFSNRKLIMVFFSSIPVMLLICYLLLSPMEYVFQKYWSKVNICPIDFPIKKQGGLNNDE